MKKFVMGVIVGCCLSLSFSVLAGSSTEQVTAFLKNGLTVVKDGEQLSLTNPPLIYNNRTYLPLKDTADAVGMSLEWQGETETVVMSSEPTPSPSPAPTPKGEVKVERTVYNGIDGIIINGVTYFKVFAYNETVRRTRINVIEFDPVSRNFTVPTPDGEVIINADTADPVDFLIYKGESYMNVKYFPQ